jgi:hypothetical protein
MSNIANQDSSVKYGPKGLDLGAQNYTSLGSLLDPTKPDVRELYVETFGDQGLTGFLDLTGAVRNAGTSDEVQWYEEGRLHRTVSITGGSILTSGTAQAFTITSDDLNSSVGNSEDLIRVNDVLLVGDDRILVKKVNAAATFEGIPMNSNSAGISTAADAAVIGNLYAQGTSQPSKFYQTALTKRLNSFIITKDTFHVNGSQATNIGWLKVGGQYRWYVKGEMDARKRFMNQREAMMLWSNGSSTTADSITAGDNSIFNKSEGYFAAVENRGIVASGGMATGSGFTDLDDIILNLDKEGAVNEYAMYLDRQTSLNIDDILATGPVGQSNITGGLASQFGAFNNDADMAVKLGFKSFTRGGYTFHKHDWKILNDPTMGGLGNVKGAMVPMTQVADAKTGIKAPALEMNYKAANGYSRDIEHWVEGGGVLGFNTNDEDVAKFHYRSECNLVTRAANQHVLIK